MIFKWSYSEADYNTEVFEPYKANNLSHEQLNSTLNSIKQVSDYDISKIRPNNCVVWFLTLLILCVFAGCVIVWFMSGFFWGLIIICVMAGFVGYCIYGIIKEQKNKVKERCEVRYNAMKEILSKANGMVFNPNGLDMKIGNRAAWLELHIQQLGGQSHQPKYQGGQYLNPSQELHLE